MIIGFYLWNQFMEYTRDWLAIVWGRGSWLYVPIVKNCRIFHQYWRIEWRFQCSHQWAATASSARSGARSACAYHVIKCATSRKIVPTERMKTKAAVRTPVTFSCSPNDGLLSLFLVFFVVGFFCFRSDRGWNGSRCDFEQGWCGWNNTLDDHSDWIRHNGSTPTSGTGPSFDNTFKNSTGMYVFVDMSSTKDLGHSTVLKSPPFPPPPKYHNNPMSTYFNSCQVSRFQLRRGIKNEAQHLASLPSSIDTVTCAERPRAWVLRTQLRGIQRTFWSSTEWKGVPI